MNDDLYCRKWVGVAGLCITVWSGVAWAQDEVPDGYSFINGQLVEGEAPAPADPVAEPAGGVPEPQLTATVINFDDVTAPCNFGTNPPLSTEYSSLGVTFGGPGERIDECGNFGVSGQSSPNFLALLGGNDVGLSFDPPVSNVSIRAGHADSGTIDITAFDDQGNLVDVTQIAGASALAPMSVLGSSIALVTVSFSGDVLVVDDLSFVPTGFGADDCFAAKIIAGEGRFDFDNTDATPDGDDTSPTCSFFGEGSFGGDVWYQWSPLPGKGGTYRLETCGGTSVDTKIAVYDAGFCSPGDTELLACNDDECGFQSSVDFTAVEGQNYLIRIGHFPLGVGGSGTFTLDCIDCPITGADDCEAVEFESIFGQGTFGFDNSNATPDGDDSLAACTFFGEGSFGRDVWYLWQPAPGESGDYRFETCGMTNVDTKIAVYDAVVCPPGETERLACNDDDCGFQSGLNFAAVEGQSYLLQVGHFPGAAAGSGNFSLTCTTCVPPVITSAVSRAFHGNEGPFDIDMLGPNTAIEPRRCSKQIVVTFDQSVEACDGTLDAEVTLDEGSISNLVIAGSELTVDLNNAPDPSCLRFEVSGICATGGSTPMVPQILPLIVLGGDANESEGVTVTDLSTVKTTIGQIADASNLKTDVNCSGGITVLDLSDAKAQIGNEAILPCP